jgi:hypothetical protein
VDLGLESLRVVPSGPGTVSAWLSYLSVLARYRIVAGPVAFILGVGARIFRIEAAASKDFVNTTPAMLIAPAALLSGEVQVTLLGGLYFSASVQGFARTRTENLDIQGIGPVLPINPVGLTAGIGVGFRF